MDMRPDPRLNLWIRADGARRGEKLQEEAEVPAAGGHLEKD